jgi:hypothetical protein
MLNKLTILLAIVLAAGLAAGCGKKTTYATNEGEVTVDKKGGEVTIESKTKDGVAKVSASDTGVALPDKFPTDVPIYKGAVIKLSSTQGKAMLVHLSVKASTADLLKFYQDQLKDQGWEIQSTMNMGEGSMLSAKKGARQCTALVMKQDKESMVQLTVSEGS